MYVRVLSNKFEVRTYVWDGEHAVATGDSEVLRITVQRSSLSTPAHFHRLTEDETLEEISTLLAEGPRLYLTGESCWTDITPTPAPNQTTT